MNKVEKDLDELIMLSLGIPFIIGMFIESEILFFPMFALFFVYELIIRRSLMETMECVKLRK